MHQLFPKLSLIATRHFEVMYQLSIFLFFAMGGPWTLCKKFILKRNVVDERLRMNWILQNLFRNGDGCCKNYFCNWTVDFFRSFSYVSWRENVIQFVIWNTIYYSTVFNACLITWTCYQIYYFFNHYTVTRKNRIMKWFKLSNFL